MSVAHFTRNLKVVGDYDLLEKLGEGGMGAVYKARKKSTAQVVALKLLPPDKSTNAIRVKRFAQEFRAASRLDHPNIVRVFDFGTAGAIHYLAMELVEGESLGARLERQRRLPETEAIDIILQTATALHQAHRAGLVHRDVKPDNILLAANGLVKLTDLGLVKFLDSETNLTRTNSGLGTPNFMAPEQFNNAKRADPRCDIYSLGATLYMCVTGEVPFRASTPLAVLKRKAAGELTPARVLVPELSERIERTIKRAMSTDAIARHASCQEFIADLTGKSVGKTVQIRRAAQPVPDNFTGHERRNRKRYKSQQQGHCIPLSGHKEDEWTARVHDIATGGIGLVVNRRFEVGSVLVVRLHGAESQLPHYLVVQVVRNQEQARRRWLLGCKFANPLSSEEVQDLI